MEVEQLNNKKDDDDNISINSEKIEVDDDKTNTPGRASNLIVNASFSRHNKENSSQLDQQSIISNLINHKREDEKSMYSMFTNNNELFISGNFPNHKGTLASNNSRLFSPNHNAFGKMDEDGIEQSKKLTQILAEKDKEANQMRDLYDKQKEKLKEKKIIYNENKKKLELIRKNNANMKLLICKLINSK